MKYLFSALAVLLIPIAIAFFMHFKVFSHALGDANGWLGYWGGYLGVLIGAATVYILTHKQLKTQEKLHKGALTSQLKLHKENLEHQKNLQMDSIKVSADMNDQRQRDLIIANLRIEKIDKLVVEIINVSGMISERFNILRDYIRIYDIREKLF
ncbi:hypothetical protein [Priestia megaterium]|uniref:hypothetical protein n=1 Tax=Priestia megaterium TaxID=1404 RepID=UPI00244BDC52|nr:hypothetical protein [Priestia megaterium]MDH2363779.1 hypothetical protein [Priestia megaterium]